MQKEDMEYKIIKFNEERDKLKIELYQKNQIIQLLKDEIEDKTSIKNFQIQLNKLKIDNTQLR